MQQTDRIQQAADLRTRLQANYGASVKQVAFIGDLLKRREVSAAYGQIDTAELSKTEASTLIADLLAAPLKAGVFPPPAPVCGIAAPAREHAVPPPAGRYAVEDEGTLKFYRIDRPTEGRWSGYAFLKVQASDDFWPIKDATTKARIFTTINADVEGALRAYGQALGACGHCGRTLTDAESREYGIGPICRGKLGF